MNILLHPFGIAELKLAGQRTEYKVIDLDGIVVGGLSSISPENLAAMMAVVLVCWAYFNEAVSVIK